jgi:hypothetical protein
MVDSFLPKRSWPPPGDPEGLIAGMRLPHADLAEVNPRKIEAYLLSESHPVGKSKARFFREAGFDESTIELLISGLLQIARAQEVVETFETVHGLKYVLEGELEAPIGRRVRLRTVWIVDQGQERPRFVTAYPASRERRP